MQIPPTSQIKSLGLVIFLAVLSSSLPTYGEGIHNHEGSHSDVQKESSVNIKPQSVCPVSGNKIDRNILVDYEGKRIFFADADSKKIFQASPKKFADAMETQGITPVGPQEYCPVSDEVIDKKISIDHEGEKIYFCCKKCRSAFRKNPEKYPKKIEAQGVAVKEAGSTTIFGKSNDHKAGSHSKEQDPGGSHSHHHDHGHKH